MCIVEERNVEHLECGEVEEGNEGGRRARREKGSDSQTQVSGTTIYKHKLRSTHNLRNLQATS